VDPLTRRSRSAAEFVPQPPLHSTSKRRDNPLINSVSLRLDVSVGRPHSHRDPDFRQAVVAMGQAVNQAGHIQV
jgi:hypothetical protein